MSSSSSISSLVDRTVILTLDSKTEDQAAILSHLRESGFDKDKVHLYKVRGTKKTINNGGDDPPLIDILTHSLTDETSENIFHNHIGMIQWAYDNNLSRVLFLEDDARFDHIREDVVRRIKTWMDENKWDIFYMGYCPWPLVFMYPVAVNVVRIPSPYLSHSYILNRSGMKKILDSLSDTGTPDIHIDKHIARMTDLKKIGIYPSICFQSKGPALYDTASRKMRLPVSFKTMCRFLETVAVMWPIIIAVLVIVFLYRLWKK